MIWLGEQVISKLSNLLRLIRLKLVPMLSERLMALTLSAMGYIAVMSTFFLLFTMLIPCHENLRVFIARNRLPPVPSPPLKNELYTTRACHSVGAWLIFLAI